MFMKMSSSRTAPLEAPFPLIGLRRGVAPLEIVWDSDEALVISMERHLLDLVSMGIPPVALGSSPLQLK